MKIIIIYVTTIFIKLQTVEPYHHPQKFPRAPTSY